MKMKHLCSVLAFLFLGILTNDLHAQVTTATIYGTITDGAGNPVDAANVVAVHEPSGSQYGTFTQSNGRYNLPNLRIGGPYTLNVSLVGYSSEKVENISLTIGQKERINVSITQTTTDLDEVVVSANSSAVINRERTGAATNVNSLALRSMPTISRGTQDFYRMTPSAAGNSFLGRNDQYNNFSLDGSIFNNPFGLDAATPGGQTNASPIPLDAIEQVQVNLAPVDITQAGFTGASINTVTKSGTNDFKGTAFVVWRNQDLTGGKVDGEDVFVPDLTQLQTGITIGGPIIKDKFFFNASFELQRREDLGSSWFAAGGSQTGSQVSRVQASDLQMVSDLLRTQYGYETGAYEGYKHATDNQKALIKLDYHINQNHSLTLKYNWLDAIKDNPAHPSAIGRRGPDATTLQFQNSGYQINNVIHSTILEYKALFSNKISNKFQIGTTAYRDKRDPFSTPFPVVNISRDGIRYIVAGHEPFSINNRLDQDVLQISNNLNIYSGDHTITVGASLEQFQFDNSFNLGVYGGLVFAPDIAIDTFATFVQGGGLDGAVAAAQAAFNDNNANDTWALAETNVGQFAAYIQDEWTVNDQLTLTFGLRMDMPLYFDTDEKIQENIDRNCCYFDFIEYFDDDGSTRMFDHTQLPDQTPLISPRIGFNYDLTGDKTQQLRGATGLYTGRFPFVWIGNHVANPNFFFYNYTETDFKFPQVWKTNIGYDQQINDVWGVTADVIYQKDINAMVVRNRGINMPTGRLTGVDTRPIYTANDRNSFPNNAYVFDNTDEGYSFNLTLESRQNWNESFFTSLAYNFTQSEDVSSIEAEISSDAYDRNPAFGNVNADVLAPSIYGNRHRIVGTLYKKFEYGDGKMATSIAAFLEYAEGNRFSYTYSGDINGDGSGLNDLIYIPTESELAQMNFASDADRTAFGAFIAQDDYLSENRGSYAEKYAILTPWYSTLDIRVLQDFNFADGGQQLQFSLDILNAGNLISSKWGNREFPTNTQPVGVGFDANGAPVYTFDPSLRNTFAVDPGLLSRWQVQLGLRYTF